MTIEIKVTFNRFGIDENNYKISLIKIRIRLKRRRDAEEVEDHAIIRYPLINKVIIRYPLINKVVIRYPLIIIFFFAC